MGCGESKPEKSDDKKGSNDLSESLVAGNTTNPAAAAPSYSAPIHEDRKGLLVNDEQAKTVVASVATKEPVQVKKNATSTSEPKVAAPAPKESVAASAPVVASGTETKWGKLNNNVTNSRKIEAWAAEAQAGDSCSFDWPKNKKGKSFHNYVITASGSSFALSTQEGESVKDGTIDEVLSHMGAVQKRKSLD